jgi:hypothetical protein
VFLHLKIFYYSNIKKKLWTGVKKSAFVSVINVDELRYNNEDVKKDINRCIL